jgi:hypothetical protein
MKNIISIFFLCVSVNNAYSAETSALTPPAQVTQSAMLRNWQAQKWDTSNLAAELKPNAELSTFAFAIEAELAAADKTMLILDEVKTKPQVHRKNARQLIDKLQKHETKFETIRKDLSAKRKELEVRDQQGALTLKVNKLYQLVSSVTRTIHDERQTMIKSML